MVKETYAEAGVKQRGTAKQMLIRIGLFVLLFVTLPISQLASFLYVLPVIVVLAMIYIFPKLHLEYEYIYVDGQIDFDRIMGGARRKTVLRMDMETVELVAPSESDELLNYAHMDGMVTKDFSSRQTGAKTYTMIGTKDGVYQRIIFEPSDKMLECMQGKTPRKVRR